MSKDHPDHHDAEIVMRLYDLRREAVMRESRDTLMTQFWPRSYEDVVAVTRREHELNRAFRQVGTFWEMAYGMVKHGIVHAGYFLESNAEGFFLFAKMQPYLESYRRDFSTLAFRNAEWAAVQSPEGRAVFSVIQARVAKLAAARLAADNTPRS
jgi:hypothetical protein